MGAAIHTLLGLLAVAAVFLAAGLGAYILTATPLVRSVNRPTKRAGSGGTDTGGRRRGRWRRLARRLRR